MNAVSAAVSDAVGRELAGEQGPPCLRVKCVDVLPRCLRDPRKCEGVGDGPAAGRACRHVLAACGSRGAATACKTKCGRSTDVAKGDDFALQECIATSVYAACRRDEAVLACRRDAAVAAQTACALDRCRADFAACMSKRCGVSQAG